jgi:hypothetical protein
MTDELELIVATEPQIVAVPQPDIQIIADSPVAPIVIESTDVEVVTIEEDVHVVDEVRDIQIVSVGEVGPPGPAGPAGTQGQETYIAGATVGGHRVLVTNAAGELIYADNTDPTHANQSVRISLQAANAGDSLNTQINGRITEPSWAWTPGATLYVGANALPTETEPVVPAVFSKPIAVAETATRILMINEPPVMLA